MQKGARDNPADPIWTRALVADPSFLYPHPCMASDVVWEIVPHGGTFEGTGYGDGSGLRPTSRFMRRCGWGLVVYENGVGVVANVHGPLPGWMQEVPAAESYSLLLYLKSVGICTLEFVTDCKFVRDTFMRGRGYSCDGWFVYSDIWRQIWDALDEANSKNPNSRSTL